MAKAITSKEKDYSQWYNDLVIKGGLADYSSVRGCMVIKPYGYAIWERMKDILDKQFKETGHQNAAFPLFIPKSFLSKEAEHVEGFAKECAVVTHYRLKQDENGKGLIVDPDAALEEELIVRPTSETIIWNTFKNWIQSYRDLPLLINQWANVVRWEMRTRLFLRTTEFFWQEGHTAHATEKEAIEESEMILALYKKFMEEYIGIPIITGFKTAAERFAGAVETYTCEGMMQDGKALQMGTSHFLGQNFAKAFDVKFADKEGNQSLVWATSWGVSTRLMGALVMAHSDDEGLVLPPKLAPNQVAIVPIFRGDDEKAVVMEKAQEIYASLKSAGVRVLLDDDETRKPGWKFAQHELKGVPLRIAIGPRDVENGTVELARRDTLSKEVINANDAIGQLISDKLNEIQQGIFDKALNFQKSRTFEVDDWDSFVQKIEDGCFVLAHWDGTGETEAKIKEKTKATIRCLPIDGEVKPGKCVLTGNDSPRRVLFAKSY